MGIWAIIEKVYEDRCMSHKEKDGFMGDIRWLCLG
jgi:hypothetical protein